MDKCTAWPWEVKTEHKLDRSCYYVIRNDSFPAAPSYRVLAVLMGGESEKEEKANAHLMASAKELYEALEIMLSDYEDAADEWDAENQEYADSVIKQSKAALNKARGEQK